MEGRKPKDKLVKRLVLPFPLATWNRLLSMNRWQRKNYRHFIHSAVSMFIPRDGDSLTQTEYQRKLRLMEPFMEVYLTMIRPSTSKASRSAKAKLLKEEETILEFYIESDEDE
jgi:hypothetical protein